MLGTLRSWWGDKVCPSGAVWIDGGCDRFESQQRSAGKLLYPRPRRREELVLEYQADPAAGDRPGRPQAMRPAWGSRLYFVEATGPRGPR
jgi:hypothetical protein